MGSTAMENASLAKRVEGILLKNDGIVDGANSLGVNLKLSLIRSIKEAVDLETRVPSIAAEQLSLEIQELRSKFLDRYRVKLIDASQISITFPTNSSVFQLLQEAQIAGPKVEGSFVVWPSRLLAWQSDLEFTKKFPTDYSVVIDGNFPNANWKTFNEQTDLLASKGLQVAPKHLLAAAFSAFFIAMNGESIFRGMDIRTANGTLYYGDGGLSEMNDGDKISTCRYQSVSVAALIEA